MYHHRRLLFALATPLLGVTSLLTPTLAVPAYHITDLGRLADVTEGAAIGLSNSGDVALTVMAGSHAHAAYWRQGRLKDLGQVSGYPNSIAYALNEHYVVVGWTSAGDNPVDSMAATRAFVRDAHGMRILGTLGGRDSRALGVNNTGRIVGVSNVDAHTRHAFVANGATLKDLGVLPGGHFSAAYAVNAAGDAAGVADTPRHINHPVIWRHGKIQDLGTLPGGGSGCAVAINARGDVAGYSETEDGIHAFVYRQGRMTDMGVLRYDPSMANSLNDRDEVVGSSNVSAHGRHAFLWRNGRMDDLNDLIAQDSGWTLSEGCAINNAGQIVCIASSKGEPNHALLLTPTVNRHLPLGDKIKG
jgi:probable HAF family extracellular repeat protein